MAKKKETIWCNNRRGDFMTLQEAFNKTAKKTNKIVLPYLLIQDIDKCSDEQRLYVYEEYVKHNKSKFKKNFGQVNDYSSEDIPEGLERLFETTVKGRHIFLAKYRHELMKSKKFVSYQEYYNEPSLKTVSTPRPKFDVEENKETEEEFLSAISSPIEEKPVQFLYYIQALHKGKVGGCPSIEEFLSAAEKTKITFQVHHVAKINGDLRLAAQELYKFMSSRNIELLKGNSFIHSEDMKQDIIDKMDELSHRELIVDKDFLNAMRH